MKTANPFDLILPSEMAKVAEEAGVYKATKKPFDTFFLAITAGVFISIAFVFYITATTGAGTAPWGMSKLVGGLCFSLGLMLVVVCGADLFTSTVLTMVAKASGRITWGQLARNWINVYTGNFFGAMFFEHSIANMFLSPLAIVIKDFSGPEFWQATGATASQFSHLTVSNFITDNLIPVTIGNIIGGGFLVGLTYWVIYLRDRNSH